MNQFSTFERLKLSQRIQDLHHKIDRGHYTNDDIAKLEYYEYLYKGSNSASTLNTNNQNVLYAGARVDYVSNYSPLFERVSFTNIDSQLRPYLNRRVPELNKLNNVIRKKQSFLERFSPKVSEDAVVQKEILSSAANPSFNINPPSNSGKGFFSSKPQVFIDIESNDRDKPISISAVKTRFNNLTNTFEVIDTYQRYYKSSDSNLQRSRLIHGLSSDTLLKLRQQQNIKYSSTYGISERGKLRKWIDDATVIGHNVLEYDLPHLFPRNQIRGMDVVDTLDAARSIYGSTRGSNNLDATLEKLTGKDMAAWGLKHHDASSDTKATMLIAQALAKSNTSYAHDLKVILNIPGLSMAPFEDGQGFGTSIIKGDPTLVGKEYSRENYLSLQERQVLEKNIQKLYNKGNKMSDSEGIKKAFQKINGSYYDDNNNEVEPDNPGISIEDTMSDLAESLRTKVDVNGETVNDSLASTLTGAVERISQTSEQLSLAFNQLSGLNKDRWVKAFAKLGDDANDSTKADLAKALGVPGSHTTEQVWRGSRVLNTQSKFNRDFRNLRSLVRSGYGRLPVIQDLKNTLSMSPEWGEAEYFDLQQDEEFFNQKSLLKESERQQRLAERNAERQQRLAERNAERQQRLAERNAERRRDKEESNHRKLYWDYRKGNIKGDDYKSIIDNGGYRSDEAIFNLYKKIDEGAESTKRWTNAIDAFKKSVGGVYDFKKWIDAGHEQSRGVLGALKGLVPSDVLGIGSRMNDSYFEAQYSRYYGIRKYAEPTTKIGKGLIAAGAALAPATGGASLIVSGIGAGVAGISQAVGTYGENSIKEKGQMLQSSINLLGGTFETIMLPFRLLGKVLRTVIKSFLALSGLLSGITVKGIRNMMDMGNPLTDLTGMNYSGYRSSVAGDYASLLRRGSLDSLRNTFATDARGLYTLGKVNTNKIVAASMLGVFGDLYNPSAGGDPVATIANKSYKRMKGASTDEKANIMYYLGELGGSELQGLVQSMHTLGMTYEQITNPKSRGITWTRRKGDESLRKQFQLDQYEFQSIGENIKWNGMRIADKLWKAIGKPVYNGLNDIIEAIADNNWDRVLEKLKSFWEGLKNFWDNNEGVQKIKDALKTPIQGIIDAAVDGFHDIGMHILKITKNIAHSLWDAIYPFLTRITNIDLLGSVMSGELKFKSKAPTSGEINKEVDSLKKLRKKDPIINDPIAKQIFLQPDKFIDLRKLSDPELIKVASARLIAKKNKSSKGLDGAATIMAAMQETGVFSDEDIKKLRDASPMYQQINAAIEGSFEANKKVLDISTEEAKGKVNKFILSITNGSKELANIAVDSANRVLNAAGVNTYHSIDDLLVNITNGD